MKKTMLITGASRGIGKAIACLCANNNYNIIITCKNSPQDLEEVKKHCEKKGSRCMTFVGDMGDSETVRKLFEIIETEFGGVDILVNNAGISKIGLFTDTSDEQWNEMIQTNLASVFYCSRAAVPFMVRNKYGCIINISSMWGNVGASCEVVYSATKGGMNSMTKALAKELAPSLVRVNALALGVIDTEMNQCLDELEKKDLIESIPCGRMGTVDEVANAVLMLIEAPSYLTGQIITMDGGYI